MNSTTIQGALFGKISSREVAINLSQWAGNGFLMVAALSTFFSFFAGSRLMFVAAIFLVCGYFTRSKMSRIAAILGVVLAALCFYLFAVLFPDSGTGLPFGLTIWIGVRGIEATFKLHGRFSVHTSSQNT